jgi:hypothetical protein
VGLDWRLAKKSESMGLGANLRYKLAVAGVFIAYLAIKYIAKLCLESNRLAEPL